MFVCRVAKVDRNSCTKRGSKECGQCRSFSFKVAQKTKINRKKRDSNGKKEEEDRKDQLKLAESIKPYCNFFPPIIKGIKKTFDLSFSVQDKPILWKKKPSVFCVLQLKLFLSFYNGRWPMIERLFFVCLRRKEVFFALYKPWVC